MYVKIARVVGFIFRCILTYEVQFSHFNISSSFKRINSRDTIFTSFLYDRSLENVSGLLICSSVVMPLVQFIIPNSVK